MPGSRPGMTERTLMRPSNKAARATDRARDAQVGLPARRASVELLAAVLQKKQPLDDILGRSLDKGSMFDLPQRDRALARAIVAVSLRRKGQLDHVLGSFLERGLPEKSGTLYPILLSAAARVNTPDWLWARWAAYWGEARARAIAAAHLIEPPLDLTVKSEPALWAERLAGRVLPTGSVRLLPKGRIEALPGFAEGEWWVQDAAAALPAQLLGNVAGKRVADLCAAPGGKTAQLVLAGASVVAVDSSKTRLGLLAENLARLGFEAARVLAA